MAPRACTRPFSGRVFCYPAAASEVAHVGVPAQDEMNRIDASPEVTPVSAHRQLMARRDRVVIRPLSRVAGEPITLALPGLLL